MIAREPIVFDFRPGTGRWGHALHTETWSEAPPRLTGPLWRRKAIPRVSVMVHATPDPEPGDKVLYTGSKSDADRTAIVVDVDYCSGVRDMFTLTLEDPDGQ